MTKPALMKLSELLEYFREIKVKVRASFILNNAFYCEVAVVNTDKVVALAYVLNLKIAVDPVSVLRNKVEIYGISDN